jgi:hypothetical protein
LNDADFNEGFKQRDIASRFTDNGCDPLGTTPQAVAAFVLDDAAKWTKVI